MRRLKKSVFKGGAAGIILLLAVFRCACPGVTEQASMDPVSPTDSTLLTQLRDTAELPIDTMSTDSLVSEIRRGDTTAVAAVTFQQAEGARARSSEPLPALGSAPVFTAPDSTPVKHKIYSVSNYQMAFPDVQDVQIQAATYWGVCPVRDRAQAEKRMNELVFVGSNPYFFIDPAMSRSIPYLVPRAADLLQTIGRNFLDSLAIKRIPAHKIIVSSLLRTEEDIEHLRRRNGNASENSCHRFGTTFDISYVRFRTVSPPGESRREVRNDSLKFVLSEVLRDIRQANRCYIKYEVKQSCFHITVR